MRIEGLMELDKLIEFVDEKLKMTWEGDANMTAFYTNMSRFLEGYKNYVETGDTW